MTQNSQNNERPFKVIDKRKFNPDGTPRQPDESEQNSASVKEENSAAHTTSQKSDNHSSPGSSMGSESLRFPEKIDFSSFALSLAHAAFYHLGEVGEEAGKNPDPPQLQIAKQFIDILRMLKQKTRGNLDSDESTLLDSLLYELQILYVSKVQKK